MKIVFITSGGENLGVEYLSSSLKSKGHEVHLLLDPAVFSGDIINSNFLSKISNVDTKIIDKTLALKPDLIGFSSFTRNYQWCLSLAERLKKVSNIPIVFGGVHPTMVPERVLENEFIDFVVIGEGEYAILDLLDHVKNGNSIESLMDTPNICFRYNGGLRINQPRPYVRDMDALPFPDKKLFYEKIPLLEEQYYIATSRGCPYSCTYCINDMYRKVYSIEKTHVRMRSPDNVIEELLAVKQRGKAKTIAFVDDVFTFSKPWLEEFIPKYKAKIGLPFWCSVHPLTITKDKALLLKEGGCYLVTMGVQSGSERIRRVLFLRQGGNDKIIEAVSCVKEAGLNISVDNIFGAPTETEEDLRISLDLYNQLKPDRILTFWLTYYPKTSILAYAQTNNYLSQEEVDNIEQGLNGTMHGTGSISKERAKMYHKYELLFQTRSLVHNDKLFNFLSKIIVFAPFKKLTSNFIILLNALTSLDSKFFYLLKYLWAKKIYP